jgi:hypothetical protein
MKGGIAVWLESALKPEKAALPGRRVFKRELGVSRLLEFDHKRHSYLCVPPSQTMSQATSHTTKPTNGRAVSQITVAMSVSTSARPSLFGVNFQPV